MKHVKGDLIEMAKNGEFDVIMHGCNCFNMMGTGIAKTIRNEFPKAFEADCGTERGDISKLGSYTSAHASLDNGHDLIVVNLYTQYQGGANAEYAAIKRALETWADNTWTPASAKIGIPWIGAGIGGLDIDRVVEIIRDVAEDKEIDITMVEYQP